MIVAIIKGDALVAMCAAARRGIKATVACMTTYGAANTVLHVPDAYERSVVNWYHESAWTPDGYPLGSCLLYRTGASP